MTAHGQCGDVLTDYVQVTHAARSSVRNGITSMETQHVYAVSRQEIPRTCCNAPSLDDLSKFNDTAKSWPQLVWSKAFDKVDYGIHIHKVMDLGITIRLGSLFFNFLNNIHYYARIPVGIGSFHWSVPLYSHRYSTIVEYDYWHWQRHPHSSMLVSFTDATRVQSCINNIEKKVTKLKLMMYICF